MTGVCQTVAVNQTTLGKRSMHVHNQSMYTHTVVKVSEEVENGGMIPTHLDICWWRLHVCNAGNVFYASV